MKITSVIICVYNEEKNIKDVVLAISESQFVGEIIVVNDGSTDNSKKEIEKLKKEIGITSIHLKVNKGKGYAMAVGVETLINLYYQSEGKTVKYVMLKGLKHPTKFDKVSKQQALREFIKEGNQIALTAFKNFDLITSSLINKSKIS